MNMIKYMAMKRFATLFFFALISGLASAGEVLTSVAEAKSIKIEDIKAPIAFDFTGTMMLRGEAWGTICALTSRKT